MSPRSSRESGGVGGGGVGVGAVAFLAAFFRQQERFVGALASALENPRAPARPPPRGAPPPRARRPPPRDAGLGGRESGTGLPFAERLCGLPTVSVETRPTSEPRAAACRVALGDDAGHMFRTPRRHFPSLSELPRAFATRGARVPESRFEPISKTCHGAFIATRAFARKREAERS